ncbi:DUF2752 domain-containing protein [Jatrophihabitans sp. DSM 45814]
MTTVRPALSSRDESARELSPVQAAVATSSVVGRSVVGPPLDRKPRSAAYVPLVTAGASLAALPVLYNVNPNTTHVPLCPLHAFTGLNCPLCGATRATYALLHGDFLTALHDNGLYVLGIPFLLVLWWRWNADARSATPRGRLLPRRLSQMLIVTVVVFGIVRNLPFAAWLSPPV